MVALPYRITGGGVSEAYGSNLQCTPQEGMGKILINSKLWNQEVMAHAFSCVFLERSDLYFIGTHEESNMLR
jgi:hypothetical protein